MSPTYWTSSQIVAASRTFGWHITPCVLPDRWWGMEKDGVAIRLLFDMRGGLIYACVGRNRGGGYDQVCLPRAYKGKLAEVLGWLENGVDWPAYGYQQSTKGMT